MTAGRGPVLVTGASGFIGRYVVADLLAAGYEVRTLHRGAPLEEPVSQHVAADIASAEARAAAAGVAAVVHLAGNGNVDLAREQPYETNRVNALGTLNVLEGARASGARVILASSQRVYTPGVGPLREETPVEPTEPYGASKRVAELWCRLYARAYGLPTVALRLFSVYGPGRQPQGTSGVLAIFARAALAGAPIHVHNRVRRDFVHVRDVVQAIRLALEADVPPGACYNVGTGVPTALPDLAELVIAAAGARVPVVLHRSGTPGGDLVPDISRARADLGFRPRVALVDGVREYVEWLRRQR